MRGYSALSCLPDTTSDLSQGKLGAANNQALLLRFSRHFGNYAAAHAPLNWVVSTFVHRPVWLGNVLVFYYNPQINHPRQHCCIPSNGAFKGL